MSKKTFADLKEREWAARRKIIVEAAERVFGVKPFNKVVIRDIAAEAGICHATIYRYFPDQQSLFVEAFLRGGEDILSRIDAAAEQKTGAAALEAVAESFIGFLNENEHYFRMMTHFMLDGDLAPELVERLNAAQRSLIDRIEAIFRAGGATEDSRALAHAFFAALNGVLISFRNYPGRNPDAVQSHMLALGKRVAKAFAPASH